MIVQYHGFGHAVIDDDVPLIVDHLNLQRRGVIVDRMWVGFRKLDKVIEQRRDFSRRAEGPRERSAGLFIPLPRFLSPNRFCGHHIYVKFYSVHRPQIVLAHGTWSDGIRVAVRPGHFALETLRAEDVLTSRHHGSGRLRSGG